MNKLEQAIQSKNGQPLNGAAVLSYNPTFVDIIAEIGYDALTMIRIPDSRREYYDGSRAPRMPRQKSGGIDYEIRDLFAGR